LDEGLAPRIGPLFVARLVESVGYLLIVIAAPSLITAVVGPRARGPAPALWSTFVPAGLALGTAITGGVALLVGWHGAFLVWALAAACALAACLGLPASGGRRPGSLVLPTSAIWLLAAGFGCYTAIEVGVLALLPAYLAGQWSVAPSLAGAATGIASATTMLGSAAASMALRRSSRWALRLMLVGLLVPALLLFAVFPPLAARGLVGASGVALLAVVWNAVSGMPPAVVFAWLPDLAERSGGGASHMAAANGVLAQFGAAGSLIGPPLLGFVASQWGWASIALAATVFSALSCGLTVLAERRPAVPVRTGVPVIALPLAHRSPRRDRS
jgi:MFS family permease